MLQHAEKRVGVWYHSYGNFLRPWLSLKLSGRCFGVSLHNADRLHWTKIILSKLRNYNHLSALNTGLCLCWWAHKIWIESNTWHGTFPDLHSVLSKPAEQLESFQVKGKNVWLSVKADKMPSKEAVDSHKEDSGLSESGWNNSYSLMLIWSQRVKLLTHHLCQQIHLRSILLRESWRGGKMGNGKWDFPRRWDNPSELIRVADRGSADASVCYWCGWTQRDIKVQTPAFAK